MDRKIEKLEEKIDKIQENLSSIDRTLAVNTATLVEHVRRTNLLEQKMEPLELDVSQIKEDVKALKPIKRHVDNVRGFFKVSGAILGALALVLGILYQLKIL